MNSPSQHPSYDSLQADFKRKLEELRYLRRQVEVFLTSPKALFFRFRPNSPASCRGQVVRDIMLEGARITGAPNYKYRGNNMLLAAFRIVEKEGPSGIILKGLSFQFAELEKQLVELRAQLSALIYGVEIEDVAFYSPSSQQYMPDNQPNYVCTVNSWAEANDYVVRLFEADCVQLWTPPKDNGERPWKAIHLYMSQVNYKRNIWKKMEARKTKD